MSDIDLAPYLDIGEGTRREAAEKLARILREGLDDAIAIPQVNSEAEEIAHAVLGCVWHTAMLIMVETATKRVPAGAPRAVRNNIDSVINSKLYHLALMAVNRGAPIGPSKCR
jgi:hypothetical protein